jgi:hypothetical protein
MQKKNYFCLNIISLSIYIRVLCKWSYYIAQITLLPYWIWKNMTKEIVDYLKVREKLPGANCGSDSRITNHSSGIYDPYSHYTSHDGNGNHNSHLNFPQEFFTLSMQSVYFASKTVCDTAWSSFCSQFSPLNVLLDWRNGVIHLRTSCECLSKRTQKTAAFINARILVLHIVNTLKIK